MTPIACAASSRATPRPIASGAHLNGLIWAARVYLGIFNDVDRAAASEARFVPILGDAHAAMALDGLVAAFGPYGCALCCRTSSILRSSGNT